MLICSLLEEKRRGRYPLKEGVVVVAVEWVDDEHASHMRIEFLGMHTSRVVAWMRYQSLQ
jgi:hypothetical protein